MKHMNSRFLKFSIFMTLWVFISTVSHGIMVAEPVQELPTGDPVVSRCFGDPSGFQLPGVVHTTLSSQSIPGEIFAKIQENIEREATLRHSVEIGPDANIAQLSIFIERNGGKEIIPIEFPVPRFFLSGTQSKSFPGGILASKGDPFNTIHAYTIPGERKPFQVIQRSQPSMSGTVDTLDAIFHYVRGTKCGYEEEVIRKSAEIKRVRDRCMDVVRYIRSFLITIPASSVEQESRVHKAIVSGLQHRNKMIIGSLENYDLSFSLVPGADQDPLIGQIRDEIRGERSNFQDLFISKHVNLACSEQLIVDALNQVLMGAILSKYRNLKDVTKIVLHIHTTKAPCKACILKVLYNLREEGSISRFFDVFPKMTPIQAIISYSDPYKDEEGYGYAIRLEDKDEMSSRGQKLLGDPTIKLWIVNGHTGKE